MAIIKYGTGVVKKRQVVHKERREKPIKTERSSELVKAAERYEQRMRKIQVEERECWSLLEMHRF